MKKTHNKTGTEAPKKRTAAPKAKAVSPTAKRGTAPARKKTQPVVSLKYAAPEAKAVFVAGTFNDWQPAATPLKKTTGGNWTAKLTLQPGSYEYLFVVDNRWVVDPQAPAAVPNPFGGCNGLLQVA